MHLGERFVMKIRVKNSSESWKMGEKQKALIKKKLGWKTFKL